MTSTSYTSLRKMLKCCSHYSTTIFRYFSYNDLLSAHVANSFSKIYSPSLLYFFNKSCVQYLNKASQNGNNMSRQLSLFSYLKKSKKENIENIVKATVESLVNEIVEEEKKQKKNVTDYLMTKEKLQIWPKDEKFYFWETPGGIPSSTNEGKNISWQYLNKASQNGNNMSRQLSLFSYLKKSKKENIENIVKATVESLEIVEEEKKQKKNVTDYLMTKEKLQIWPKDEKFYFWETPGGIPSSTNEGKNISWLNIDAVNERFMCWVCQKYPQISNQNNKVTVGCSVWHRNYLIRHEDEKHNSLFVFHTPVSNNSTVTIIFFCTMFISSCIRLFILKRKNE